MAVQNLYFNLQDETGIAILASQVTTLVLRRSADDVLIPSTFVSDNYKIGVSVSTEINEIADVYVNGVKRGSRVPLIGVDAVGQKLDGLSSTTVGNVVLTNNGQIDDSGVALADLVTDSQFETHQDAVDPHPNIEGTDSSTFEIDQDAVAHPTLVNDAGELKVRNADNSAYADLRVKDLIAEGTVTAVNTETIEVSDNIILLNKDVTATPTEDAGIEIERGTSANAQLLWDETNDIWKAGVDGSMSQVLRASDIGSGVSPDISGRDAETSLTTGMHIYIGDDKYMTREDFLQGIMAPSGTTSYAGQVLADLTDPTGGVLSEKVDQSTLTVDTAAHKAKVKAGGITATELASNIDMSAAGFIAEKAKYGMIIDLGAGGNIDNLTVSGEYYVGANGTTAPTTAAYYIQHINYDANNALQIASLYAPSAISLMHRRVKVAGAWKNWYRWRSDAETDYINNQDLSNMAENTIKGRATSGTGDPEDMTVAQATAVLSSSKNGLVPTPTYNYSNGYLVKTDIASDVNAMIVFEIKGYAGPSGERKITHIVGNLYAYVSDIVWQKAMSYGDHAPTVDVFYYDGFLHLFFAQPEASCGYVISAIKTYTASGTTNGINCITTVTNAAKPSSGVTYSKTITPLQVLNTNTVPAKARGTTVTETLTSLPKTTGLNSSQTNVTFESSHGLSNGDRFYIDSEIMTVTSVTTPDTCDISRASLGTAAAAHASAANVYKYTATTAYADSGRIIRLESGALGTKKTRQITIETAFTTVIAKSSNVTYTAGGTTVTLSDNAEYWILGY